ncbi:MAG: hypothetical protein K6F77_04150, partial [Lachnospiraceae bacterium]|nr:hypothetical protein [Lachnospiraceae bacterium]
KYINVGLTQGKYFDHKNSTFVSTSDDNWYASPNITGDYAEGDYNLRSIYIRSTTGESVHYSLENANLDDSYKGNSIKLSSIPVSAFDQLIEALPEKPWLEDSTEETIEEEPVPEAPVDEELEEEPEEEHEHELEYISNGDGTHTVHCIGHIHTTNEDGEEVETECDYEEIEACTFDEEGKCIYCGYTKEEEEKEFNPSISFSITNQTCTIGVDNPVISLNISQEDYSIAYAQVCFANYDNDKYINVGLTQGKYFDHKNSTFVSTSDSNWYASPNITSNYAEGDYNLRSIYIRSTTGESIHYSLEADTLNDTYKNASIKLIGSTTNMNNESEEVSQDESNNPDTSTETQNTEEQTESTQTQEDSYNQWIDYFRKLFGFG